MPGVSCISTQLEVQGFQLCHSNPPFPGIHMMEVVCSEININGNNSGSHFQLQLPGQRQKFHWLPLIWGEQSRRTMGTWGLISLSHCPPRLRCPPFSYFHKLFHPPSKIKKCSHFPFQGEGWIPIVIPSTWSSLLQNVTILS